MLLSGSTNCEAEKSNSFTTNQTHVPAINQTYVRAVAISFRARSAPTWLIGTHPRDAECHVGKYCNCPDYK